MSNEHNFLITYGLHNFVTHAQSCAFRRKAATVSDPKRPLIPI